MTVNNAVVKVPWEPGSHDRKGRWIGNDSADRNEDEEEDDRRFIGPVGEYLEVVDVDPASGAYYQPVDLNDPNLLAQDGLPPSEGNPQFHQQMVYAVAMLTIRNFERALGRLLLWSPHRRKDGDKWRVRYVPRLRIYPHALREANAYYSPVKKALLFGYFPAPVSDPRQHMPRGMVFTCLSHDIVAHETTHALLDGLHRRYIEPSNVDVLAFHEAFADIVAILQHFTFPEVLRHQIAKTRGDLGAENLLAKLAVQFGRATSRGGALRDALGVQDGNEGWTAHRPDPYAIDQTHEPHARGAILVAAIFDAFVSIYRMRTRDLVRIATGGSGVLPDGDLHPDLVNRLAGEATKAAQHILTMCIRALDYCPPVDITFGDYLRALVTADYELVQDDDLGYRVAVISAFRQRGIFPKDVRTLSVESLIWAKPDPKQRALLDKILPSLVDIRAIVSSLERPPIVDETDAAAGMMTSPAASPAARFLLQTVEEPPLRERTRPSRDRRSIFARMNENARYLHGLIRGASGVDGSPIGLDLSGNLPVEVHAVRPTRRVGPDGQTATDLLVVITQRRFISLPVDGLPNDADADPERRGFFFRGGCTIIIDPDQGDVRYCITKNINSDARRGRQEAHLKTTVERSALVAELGIDPDDADGTDGDEPFAVVHGDAAEEQAL